MYPPAASISRRSTRCWPTVYGQHVGRIATGDGVPGVTTHTCVQHVPHVAEVVAGSVVAVATFERAFDRVQ